MGKMTKKFYITTPIYYPSDKLHIGHAYSTVAADTLARYKRLKGYDTFFLTGTDEHGQKIERKAAEAGKDPKKFTDNLVVWIKDLWDKLDISYDEFIRTTDIQHKEAVQTIFTKLLENDDIYLSKYEGLYCTPCETFLTEFQTKDGKCPDCERELEKVEEESYFLRISKYENQLKEFYEKNPTWLEPSSRKNELVENFLNKGLEDLSISRTTFSWGIPVPNDPKHVVYVWIDALTNYWSAIGYGSDDPKKQEQFQRYFPADVHLIGKEIVRFHGIYLPVLHLALSLPLPGKLFAHGWLLLQGGKMSKSKGNIVDPKVLIEQYGSDTLRYFLLREIPFGKDGTYSQERFEERINGDLVNAFSNLIHRSLTMIQKSFDFVIPTPQNSTNFEENLIEFSSKTIQRVEESLNEFQLSVALTHLWELIAHTNKYIDDTQAWGLAKRDPDYAQTVFYHLAEALRIIAVLLQPFLPKSSQQVFDLLTIQDETLKTWESAKHFGSLPTGTKVLPSTPIFKRLNNQKK